MSRLTVPSLTGQHVSLEPMAIEHVDAIAAAGATDFTAVVIPDRDGPTRSMDLLQART